MQTQQLANLFCGWQFFEELTVLCRRKLALAGTYRPTFADKTILTCQWHTPFLSSLIFSFLSFPFFSSFFFSFSLFSFPFFLFLFLSSLFSFFHFPFFLFLFSFLSLFLLSFLPLFHFPPSLEFADSSKFCRQNWWMGGCHTPPHPPYRDAPAWVRIWDFGEESHCD